MREIERAMADQDSAERRARLDVELADRARTATVRDRRAVAENLVTGSVALGDNEPVRPGDVLVISIHGEPDVPRVYTVASDGTLKLPLSPPMRVRDLTAPEVEQLLVKQLTARGLDRPAAEVSLRRPR